MSHFTVLVVGQDIEKQLAPFQENNMGDCPREYMEFEDEGDELRRRYAEESEEMVVLPDGEQVVYWNKRVADAEKNGRLERVQVPHKVRFATFEAFADEYASGKDEETGRYGYWHNPNSKWDYWQLGGRWTGYFKLKPGTNGESGRPGLFTPRAEVGYADAVLKKNIDFEAMRAEAEARANATYDRYDQVVSEHGVPPEFADLRQSFENIEDARAAYWALPAVKAFRDADLMPWNGTVKDKYGMGRDEFVARARASCFTPYALLMDGEWYEQGKMGWFGISHDDKDADSWNAEVGKLLDTLPEDTLLSAVDCHI